MQAATNWDDETEDTLPPAAPSKHRQRRAQRAQVLLVEPAPIIQTFIKRALIVHGYEVTCAATAAEAEQALLRSAPTLVIAELNLADGSGEAVCARARALCGAQVAVVLMSTGSEQSLLERAARCAADRCFTKTRGINALLPLVDELVLDLG